MAKFGNRVKETSDTTGTGTLDLAGAPIGFRSFAQEFLSGDTVYYLLVDDPENPVDYEYGIGTFTNSTPDTLSRDTVEGSSNGGSKVAWTAGCVVIATPTASALPLLTAVNIFSALQKWSKGADVASANALSLGNDGNYFDITGTTSITSIGTKGAGTTVKLHFDAALTLTHHSTDLVLPGAANITTAAGDESEFVEYATGDWRCTHYQRASGLPVANTAPTISRYRATYEVASGAAGTTYTASDWRVVPITEKTDAGNVGAISSNRLTLAAGTWDIDAWVVVNCTNTTVVAPRLYNFTQTAEIAKGVSMNAGTGVGGQASIMARVVIKGFVANGTDAIEFQVYPTITTTAGLPVSTGSNEVYAELVAVRIA